MKARRAGPAAASSAGQTSRTAGAGSDEPRGAAAGPRFSAPAAGRAAAKTNPRTTRNRTVLFIFASPTVFPLSGWVGFVSDPAMREAALFQVLLMVFLGPVEYRGGLDLR